MEDPGADQNGPAADRRARGLQKLADRRERLRKLRRRVAGFAVAVFAASMVMVLAGREPAVGSTKASTGKAASTATQSAPATQSSSATSDNSGDSSFTTTPAPVTTSQS